jgi:hypothetical protein
MKMKKWIWVMILLLATLILSSCSTPIAITATAIRTELPVLKTDTPVPQVTLTKTKTIAITETITRTKVNTPVILFTPDETLTALDKKRRYEARISYRQMQMIAIAIDEYFSNKGSYPDSLIDLVPDYLEKVPLTITGQEIRYLKSDVYIYNLIFNLVSWDNKGLCVYHRDNEEFECGLKYDD